MGSVVAVLVCSRDLWLQEKKDGETYLRVNSGLNHLPVVPQVGMDKKPWHLDSNK